MSNYKHLNSQLVNVQSFEDITIIISIILFAFEVAWKIISDCFTFYSFSIGNPPIDVEIEEWCETLHFMLVTFS